MMVSRRRPVSNSNRFTALHATAHTGEPLLMMMVRHNNIYMTRFLLNCGADPNCMFDGDTPLTLAMKKASPFIIQALLECPRTDYLMCDSHGNSALILAAFHEREFAFRYLLHEGANPLSTAEHGEPLIAVCIKKRNLSMVQLLLETYNVSPDIRDFCDIPLLALTIYQKDLFCFDLLIRNGADITVSLPNGQTLLEIAICERLFMVVKLLLYERPREKGFWPLRSARGDPLTILAGERDDTLSLYNLIVYEATICIQHYWKQFKERKSRQRRPSTPTLPSPTPTQILSEPSIVLS